MRHSSAGGGIVGPQPRGLRAADPQEDEGRRTPWRPLRPEPLRRIHVLDSIVMGDTPSAKEAAQAFAGLTERPNLLVVIERGDDVTYKSVRNLTNVHVLVSDQLNTYDVLCADDIVFTQAALDAFVAAGEKGAKADQPAKEDLEVERIHAKDPATS